MDRIDGAAAEKPRGALASVAASLSDFKGNARTCILVEPLWGIPYNLFVPYASLYMLALGVSKQGIGLIATAAMVLQTLWSLTAGAFTDRFGRRRTSLYFDLLAWSVPTLLWALARDFRWFLAAGILNSMVRVVHVSWSCLFIEDTPARLRVRLYTWISVAGTLSGFFAPLAGLLVAGMGLVPAVRALYALAFISMTAMFFLRNAFCTETSVGLEKMREIREGKRRGGLEDYAEAARIFFRSREAVVALALAVLANIHLQVRNSFLSVVLTAGLGLPEGLIAVFPFLATAATLLVYLTVIPRIKRIRSALAAAWGANLAANLVILLAPGASGSAASLALAAAAVVLGTLLAAVGMGVAGPVVDAVLANAVDDRKRAVTLSLAYTLIYGLAAPFGWIAGLLAEAGPRLPALLMAAVTAAAALMALALRKE